MKILQVESYSLVQQKNQKALIDKSKLSQKQSRLEISLPSSDTSGMSLVFKGISVKKPNIVKSDNLMKLISEIAVTEAKLKALLDKKTLEKTAEIVKAEDLVHRYEYWQENQDNIFDKALEDAKKARDAEKEKHGAISNFFRSHGKIEFDAIMYRDYYSKKEYYEIPFQDYSLAKIKVDSYNKMQHMNEESRLEQIKLLEETLKAYKSSVNLMSIRDAVNEAMNSEGALNDTIAGYEIIKNEIQRSFITPLIENIKAGNNDLRVPPAVMLYGATGCGKTTMLNAIKHQLKGYARVIDISTKSEEKAFLDKLAEYLDNSRMHYLKTKKENGQGERTILLLNEAEIYFATNPEDMGTSGLFFDKSDIKKMESFNKNNNCINVVAKMKSYLDHISNLPTESEPNGYATTIFITSNYPHLIHRDLLSRDGDNGKLLRIPVRPASGEDLKEVIKHYFTKFSNLIEQIKFFAKQENPDALIDSLAKISDKGKDLLKSKVKDGTIENMYIDPTLSGFKNIDMFIEGNGPSPKRGAFSNARIETIATTALVNYIENPAVSYEKHFLNAKNAKGMDISPQAYRQFENICDMVENPVKFKQKNFSDISSDVQELIDKYYDGEISKEEISNLKLAIKDIKTNYLKLKNSDNLSTSDLKIKEQYEEFLDSIDDIEFPEY